MQANELFDKVQSGDRKSLARAISVVENELSGYEAILQLLPSSPARIIGITGPPGAGKSTLVDGLIGLLRAENKKIAVLCVDPSSAFNKGAILGDRIRMNEWFTDSNVYIRSLGTRGSLGGLHPKIIEITDLLKAAGFDQIIIETVGVGQSEIEIAGLADATVVVLVPESGDEVQTMKAGLMEIADIFVVNKSDRPQADVYLKYLQQMLAPTFSKHYQEVPVIKTVATTKEGLQELHRLLMHQLQKAHVNDKTFWLLAERAFYLIGQKRMKGIDKSILKKEIEAAFQKGNFNLYKYIADK
jgi:LAO/AO transport system kinase